MTAKLARRRTRARGAGRPSALGLVLGIFALAAAAAGGAAAVTCGGNAVISCTDAFGNQYARADGYLCPSGDPASDLYRVAKMDGGLHIPYLQFRREPETGAPVYASVCPGGTATTGCPQDAAPPCAGGFVRGFGSETSLRVCAADRRSCVPYAPPPTDLRCGDARYVVSVPQGGTTVFSLVLVNDGVGRSDVREIRLPSAPSYVLSLSGGAGAALPSIDPNSQAVVPVAVTDGAEVVSTKTVGIEVTDGRSVSTCEVEIRVVPRRDPPPGSGSGPSSTPALARIVALALALAVGAVAGPKAGVATALLALVPAALANSCMDPSYGAYDPVAGWRCPSLAERTTGGSEAGVVIPNAMVKQIDGEMLISSWCPDTYGNMAVKCSEFFADQFRSGVHPVCKGTGDGWRCMRLADMASDVRANVTSIRVGAKLGAQFGRAWVRLENFGGTDRRAIGVYPPTFRGVGAVEFVPAIAAGLTVPAGEYRDYGVVLSPWATVSKCATSYLQIEWSDASRTNLPVEACVGDAASSRGAPGAAPAAWSLALAAPALALGAALAM